MKRYALIIFVGLFCFNFVNAQDIIITKDAQKIFAKINEVGENVVKYKKFDNLEGPIYTMKKADISSIIYENGTVDVFKEATAPQPQKQPSGYMIGEARYFSRNIGEISGYGLGSSTVVSSGFLFAEGAGSMSSVELAKTIRENPQSIMTTEEYVAYIRQYAPEAYRVYQKGNALGIAGTMFLTVGLCSIVLSPLWLLYDDRGVKEDYTALTGAMSMLGGGTLLCLGSIPFYTVAFKKMRVSSCNEYNSKYAPKYSKTDVSLNVGASRYGLGVSLSF